MKQHIMTAAGIFALGIALTSSSASALDWMYPDEKAFPGSECQPYDGSQAGDFTTGLLSIRNNATTTRLVSCPLINDNGNEAKQASVIVYSPSGTTTSCIMFNTDSSGSVQSWRSISMASYGYKTGASFDTYAGTGTYFQNLWCALPAKGELFGYSANW